MPETELTAAEASALNGTTDADVDFKYHSPGDAAYYTEGQRQRHRLLTLGKALGNRFRVYKDGTLTCGVRAGRIQHGASQLAYAGSTGNPLMDDAANYIYLDIDSAALRLVMNTTGFPDPTATPHIPLASIVAAGGAYTDIADYRQVAAFRLVSGLTAAVENALVPAVPSLALSGQDGADGTGTMTIQAQDAAGANLAARFRVRCWRAAAAYAAPAACGDFSVATGTELRELTADADYEAITDADGLVVMDLADAGTHHVMAEVDGRIYTASVTITGP